MRKSHFFEKVLRKYKDSQRFLSLTFQKLQNLGVENNEKNMTNIMVHGYIIGVFYLFATAFAYLRFSYGVFSITVNKTYYVVDWK